MNKLTISLIVGLLALGCQFDTVSSLHYGEKRSLEGTPGRPHRSSGTYEPKHATVYDSSSSECEENSSTTTVKPTTSTSTDRECPLCKCPGEEDLICGTDGKRYQNECAFSCRRMCDPTLQMQSITKCY